MSEVTTYSMWRNFRNCRKKYQLRYEQRLVPLEISDRLTIGSNVHNCLELWYKTRDLGQVIRLIDSQHPERSFNPAQKAQWHLISAMMGAYIDRYKNDAFEIVDLEAEFSGSIINPETGYPSRSFVLAGKVDGIIKMPDGLFYIMEHKTASTIDESYIAKLWTDFQVMLYAHYIEKERGIKIAGVLYNMLGKTAIRQQQEESEQDFAVRKAELEAKSKSGKSSAQRKLGETDEVFRARLIRTYQDNLDTMFQRRIIIFSKEQFERLQYELWELTQALLEAKRRGMYYQNPSMCYQYRTPCEYFSLCSSGESPVVRDNYFRVEKKHSELSDAVGVAPF